MNFGPIILHKKIGETPLECLELFRLARINAGETEFADIPMTYAGRLDPMASGLLLILIGDACKKKEKYLDLDKEYVVEVLFGVSTDTHDILGLIDTHSTDQSNAQVNLINFKKYVGKFTQKYPAYSSKTVEGKQLHTLARSGDLPDELPTKDVEIYSIENMGTRSVSAGDLLRDVVEKIGIVKGDFRQEDIIKKWKIELIDLSTKLTVIKLKVSCSSGTYMRSLADRIGRDIGIPTLALSIERTKIGQYDKMSVCAE